MSTSDSQNEPKTAFGKFLEKATFEQLIAEHDKAEKLAKNIVSSLSDKVKPYQAHILVDLYGVYVNAKKLWKHAVDTKNSWAVLEIARYTLEALHSALETKAYSLNDCSIGYHQIYKICLENLSDQEKVISALQDKNSIVQFCATYNYFYASDVEGNVYNKLKKIESSTFDDIKRKECEKYLREYSTYNDFKNSINKGFLEGSAHEGFLRIDIDGEKFTMAEKQVDTNLTIEAMDILHSESADEVVIVSNDTDFLPLAKRFNGSKVRFSQVPLGDMLAGKRDSHLLKNLDNRYLGIINPEVILKRVAESVDAMPIGEKKPLTNGELKKIFSPELAAPNYRN